MILFPEERTQGMSCKRRANAQPRDWAAAGRGFALECSGGAEITSADGKDCALAPRLWESRVGIVLRSDVVGLRLDRLAAIDLEAFAPGGTHLGSRVEEFRDAREFLEGGRHRAPEIDQHVGMFGGQRAGS